MATAYTPILQLALPVTGELQGTWGTVVNDNITSMIEQAIAGLATVSTWTAASHTLTTANGTTDEARCAVLECSGAPGAAATVVCPALSKVYVIKNSVTGGYAVTLKTSAGTGISVPNGSTALLYCDGTNVVSGATYMATLSTTQVDILAQGDLRLQDTTGGEYVAIQAPATLAASYTLTLPVDDGTAGQVLVTDGSGVLSWSSAGVFTTVTASSLTSGRVTYAGTAGLLQDSANLTFNGTTLTNTGNTIISDNSANAALRVTQIGAGNALLVEDSANPDSSPFVVDASGRVVIGTTAGIASYGAANVSLQEHGLVNTTSSAGLFNWGSSATSQAGLLFAKSKSNVIGTRGIVSSSDQLGEINFAGDDGVAFIPAASIRSVVHGTPGVNDMPGVLIFSTTADGAAAVTERMRINAAGEALIGTASSPGVNLSVSKNITSAANATGVLSNGQLQTDVTSTAQYFNATPSQIIGSTLSQLRLFAATQGTFSGRVNNQHGFFVNSALTGATNNYGFYSDIATTPSGGTAASTVSVVNSSGTTVTVGTVATHGLSTGQVVTVSMTADAAALISGVLCTILTVGTTDFTLIGAASNTVGVSFTATGTGAGTGTVTLNQQGSGKTITVIDTFSFSYTATSATFTNIVATGTVTPSARFNFYANGTAPNVFVGTTSIGGVVGAEGLRVTPVTSAVNYLEVTGATTSNLPAISAAGSDTNITIKYIAKGAANHQFQTGSSAVNQFVVVHAASAVNYLQVSGGSTGNATVLSAAGSDTNIDIALTPKGTGNVRFGTLTANADAPITGYITIKDSGGTTRKLAIIA